MSDWQDILKVIQVGRQKLRTSKTPIPEEDEEDCFSEVLNFFKEFQDSVSRNGNRRWPMGKLQKSQLPPDLWCEILDLIKNGDYNFGENSLYGLFSGESYEIIVTNKKGMSISLTFALMDWDSVNIKHMWMIRLPQINNVITDTYDAELRLETIPFEIDDDRYGSFLQDLYDDWASACGAFLKEELEDTAYRFGVEEFIDWTEGVIEYNMHRYYDDF